jgi:glycosyltransferase involved in cell wall biosynthesis
MAPTVLVNAGPWLPVPPDGYGGIENVIATLIPELRRRGAEVWLCAAAGSTLEVDRLVPTLPEPMFAHLTGPYNRNMGIAHAHMHAVMRALQDHAERIDLVHDHLEVVGPSVLGAMGAAAPPVLQTLHWDLRKHPDFYATFDGGGRIFFNGVSAAQLATAPQNLRRQALGAVPLSAPVEAIPFEPRKDGPLLVLARIAEVKGQDLAARMCRERGWRLDLAGPVAGWADPAALAAAAAGPDAPPDVHYYRERVEPLLDGERVRWIGSVTGAAKAALLGRARALLCPIRWDEPGATAVVEALAAGTPVIGMRRGALPMLVEHGVTGFLAEEEAELAGYAERAGEIDPRACRRAALERFTPAVMAEAYLGLYGEVIRRAGTAAPPGAPAAAPPPGRGAAPVPLRSR